MELTTFDTHEPKSGSVFRTVVKKRLRTVLPNSSSPTLSIYSVFGINIKRFSGYDMNFENEPVTI